MLKAAGNRMNDKIKNEIKETLIQLLHTVHEGNRLKSATCLGILTTCFNNEQLIQLMKVKEERHLVN